MIDQIVHPGFHPLGRTKIDPVQFANGFDLLPRAREPDHCGMEFLEVRFENRGCVASWVAGYEEREEGERRGWGRGKGRGDEVDHRGHFVELFRTNVGAVGEAKVDLFLAGKRGSVWELWLLLRIFIEKRGGKEMRALFDSHHLTPNSFTFPTPSCAFSYHIYNASLSPLSRANPRNRLTRLNLPFIRSSLLKSLPS